MKKTITAMLLCCSSLCFSQQVTTRFRCAILKPSINLANWEKQSFDEMKQGYIPKGKVLDVIGVDTINYCLYKVRYKNKSGYIHRNVVVDQSILINKDPKIRNEFKECVIERSIAIGMTKYELIASMGNPLDINRTVSASGVKEQYCYGTVNTKYYAIGLKLHTVSTTSNQIYLYLEDDIVTSYSD